MTPNEATTIDTGTTVDTAVSVPAWKAASAGLADAYAEKAAAPLRAAPPADDPGGNRFPGFDPLPGPFLIDEVARRKKNGLFECPLVMADGQVWYLPKPRVRLTPADNEDGYAATLSLKGADGFQTLVRALNDAEGLDAGPARGLAMIRAEMALARALMDRNYELTTDELAAVVQFGDDPDDDPEGVALREAVVNLAFGVAPKRSGGTAG